MVFKSYTFFIGAFNLCLWSKRFKLILILVLRTCIALFPNTFLANSYFHAILKTVDFLDALNTSCLQKYRFTCLHVNLHDLLRGVLWNVSLPVRKWPGNPLKFRTEGPSSYYLLSLYLFYPISQTPFPLFTHPSAHGKAKP